MNYKTKINPCKDKLIKGDAEIIYNVKWPKNRAKFDEYMAGLIHGDGQLERKRITITDSDERFLHQVSSLVQKYWNLTPKIHKRTNVNAYYMRIYSVDKVIEIKEIIEKLVEKPTTNFIRGFFDAEGSIHIEQPWRKKYVVISLSSVNPVIIANIQTSLYDRCIYGHTRMKEYFDKRPNRNKKYKIYILRIKRQSSVMRFLQKIGLRHPKHIVKVNNL